MDELNHNRMPRCEKIRKSGTDTVFAPRNPLKLRTRPARKGLSVPDFLIFSQLWSARIGLAGGVVAALTLGAMLAAAAVPGQYIVEMAGDPVAVHAVKHAAGIRSEAARQRRTQIRQEQRLVRTQLEAAEAEILDSVDTVVNAFIVRIPDEKAAQLESIPGVVRVYPVRTFKLNLDHALPLHGVPEAWRQ